MIHLEVLVADAAELLDANAYGAGALLRWESCATVDGAYVEGGTVALVAGTSLYDVWDDAGLIGTWYRTRISDAGGTTFSPYSAPFMTAEHGLYLSVDQFRAFDPVPSLTDEALLILLDAAAQAIIREVGYSGEKTEWLRGGRGPLLMLGRAALTVTAITENGTVLDPDDWELSGSGQTLRRVDTGPNPSWYWRGNVDVTYLPRDDTAERQRVQRDLVMLDLQGPGGVTSERIGDWQQNFATNASPAQARAAILASLGSGVGIL